MSQVEDKLKEMGLANAKIGMEASYVNAARWAEIESLLPDAQFVDCTSLMNSVRWIKTPAEIALLKESADIQDDAHLEVFPTIRPGDRERDIHARFLRSHIERGCHFGVDAVLNDGDDFGRQPLKFEVHAPA